MATILALDASTEVCSVALVGPGVSFMRSSVEPRTHAQKLLPLVDEVLRAGQISLQTLDAVAYSSGPGSFTGLRIAFGCAQGLAFGADLPMIGISSLEAMALSAHEANLRAFDAIACLLDARMNEIYWAVYRVSSSELQCLSEPCLSSPEVTLAQLNLLRGSAGERLAVVGPGVGVLSDASRQRFLAFEEVRPSAQAIATLAGQRFSQGQATSAEQAQLVYLRDSVSWNKRQRIRALPDASS